MEEFLAIALSAPTLIFTALMGVMVLYWISVMLGAVDLELLDPGAGAEGVDGALDGAADGALEAGADGALEAGADAGDGAGAAGGLAAVLAALKLRYAPLTVTFSVLTVLGWLGTFFGTLYLAPVVPGGAWVAGLAVTLAALAVALPLTSLLTRPLAPLFRTARARSNRDLIGSVVTVKTGSVDRRFGQAELDDGEAGLLLRVRCEDEAALGRGDRALVVAWDPDEEVFEVEPMAELLGEEARSAGGRPRRRGRRA